VESVTKSVTKACCKKIKVCYNRLCAKSLKPRGFKGEDIKSYAEIIVEKKAIAGLENR